MFQSHLSPSIQSSSRRRMNGGIHSSSAARARNRSACSRTAMNHCGLIWNSTGVWHRSCTPTTCRTGSLLTSSPASSEGLDDGRTGLGQRQPGELAGQLAETAVRLHHQAQVQVVAPPLEHVLAVAERAHHHQPGAVLRVHGLVGEDRHLVAEQRHGRPLQPGVPGVAGMVVQRHAGRQQLGPGGGDQQVRSPPNLIVCSLLVRSRSSTSAWASEVRSSGHHRIGSWARRR